MLNAPKKIVSGMAYLLVCTYLGRSYGFLASTVLLPRLIDAGTMGGVALGASTFLLLMSMKDLGFSFALMHHQERIDELAPTHFLLNVLVSAVWIGVAVSVLLLSHYFPPHSGWLRGLTASLEGGGGSLALWAVVCFCAADLFRSASYTAETRLKARLAFRAVAVVHMLALVLSLTVALVLAHRGLGGWALIIGGAASYVTYSPVYVLFTVFCIWRLQPWELRRVRLNRSHARELWHYGRWVWVGDIFYTLLNEVPKIVAGALLGWAQLGYYFVAYTWAQMSVGAITHILVSLTNPVYARYQKDRERLSLAFNKMLRLVARAVCLLNLIFLLESERLVGLAGAHYGASVPLLRLLVPFALLRPFLDDAHSLFLAVGDPKAVARINLVQAVLSVVLVALLSYAGGIRGIAVAAGLTAAVGLLIAVGRLRRHVDVAWGRALIAPLASASVALGVGLWADAYLPSRGALAVAGRVALDTALYTGMLVLLERQELLDEWRFLRQSAR